MTLKVAGVFSDHMVLQAGMAVPVWGWASPGASVAVHFAGQSPTAVAGADGRWEVSLDPLSASCEPRTLTVTDGVATLSFSDVLAGEVWLCSGQSNMQFTVSAARDGEREAAAAHHPQIRMLTVPRVGAERPQSDLSGIAWRVCAPVTVRDFSAVGYFFGRELHRRLKVPIGLVDSSWGGTVAEAWTSREGLQVVPALKGIVDELQMGSPEERQAAYEARVREIKARTRDAGNAGWERGWAAPAEPAGEWREIDLPRTWQSAGLSFSGVLWFRRQVDLPGAWVGRDLKLEIGACDKSDTTYVNGVRVGGVSMQDRPDAYSLPRVYDVPGNAVKSARACIAVRVHSDRLAGGMTGKADRMRLSCPSLPGSPAIQLAGTWRYAVEQNYGLVQYPPAPLGPKNKNTPCGLFNAMIAPLIPYALRGTIWYQGESNAPRARQYRALFPALIRDWRRRWGRDTPGAGPAFPFLFVQLANFREVQSAPCESGWADLREAQAMALRLPDTGMAVAIDIGEAADIHPKNKQDVGLRLAFQALANVYRVSGVVASGPLFREARREGPALRVRFTHADGGLACRGDELRGFAIAGAERRFVWAQARIEGDTVVVSGDTIRQPEAVRYAWANNPIGNLYNGAGLPAAPFRSDTWDAGAGEGGPYPAPQE